MSIIKQLFPSSVKFTPASSEIDWTRIETLVHGPGVSDRKETINSAVFACLMAISTAYTEPPLMVKRRMADGQEEEMPEHPLQELLERPTPNGELSIDEMLFWTAWAKHIDGNAYWIKVRSGNAERGNVIELWPISPTMIRPVSEGNDWISYYKYHIRPNEFENIPVNNIVHFRLGLDDQDMRLGLSPLKALVREITTDTEADTFIASLLKNYAVPGLVVIPSGMNTLKEDEAEKLASKFRHKFGSDNRGNVAVMSKDSRIEQFGFSPKELDMTVLHRVPEERISAVLGVPAIVAGLGAGLDRATYANFKEAREMFTESKLIPQWRSDDRKIDTSLVPDFSGDSRDVFVERDLTEVRALQEDEDARYTRLQKAVGKPWMTRNEARTEIGLDPVDEWDAEDIAPPEPVTPSQPAMPGVVPPQLAASAEAAAEAAEEEAPMKADLLRWQRKAVKALGKSDSAAVSFESDTIPPILSAAIAGQLEAVTNEEELSSVFRDVMVWGAYP